MYDVSFTAGCFQISAKSSPLAFRSASFGFCKDAEGHFAKAPKKGEPLGAPIPNVIFLGRILVMDDFCSYYFCWLSV